MVSWLTQQVFWLQILVIIGAMLLAIGLLWMLFSLVLLPLIAFLQRLLAPVENTTSVSDRDYLLGTVTLAVSDGHTGDCGPARIKHWLKAPRSSSSNSSKASHMLMHLGERELA